MIATWLIVSVLGLVGIGGSVWAFVRMRGSDTPLAVRVPLGLVPLSIGVLLFSTITLLCSSPIFDWNGAKLAPTLAMLKGYPLYPDRDTGVMTAWIYGPLPALLMLPVALVAHTPTTAIVLGCTLTLLMVLVPALWLHLRAAKFFLHTSSAKPRWVALLAFAAFGWMIYAHQSMLRAILMIGPDGPTLGLLTCSITVLVSWRRGMIRIALSALCVVLACWCKQSVLPAVVVAPLYLLLSDGWLGAVNYLLALLIAGAVVSIIFLAWFGPSNLWFHMVMLSAHHGWRGESSSSRWALFGSACLLLLNDITPTLALFGAGLLVGRFVVPAAPAASIAANRRAEWFRANPWIMLPMMAVALLPASLLGYLKVGGYLNNFSLTHYFLIATATVYLIRLSARAPREHSIGRPSISGRFAVMAMLAFFLLWSWPEEFLKRHKAETMFASITTVRNNQQEAVYAYALKQPGKVYFPWNVLATLMAEGKYYHFEWGIVDRLEAHLPPSRAQCIAHLPEHLEYVAFGPAAQSDLSMALFEPPASRNVQGGFVFYPETLADLKASPDLGKASQR